MPVTPLSCPVCQTSIPANEVPGKRIVCPDCGYLLPAPAAAPETGVWFYARGRQKCGPVPMAELQRLAAASKLQPGDMVLQAGASKWVAAGSVAGLFLKKPPGPPTTPSSPAPSDQREAASGQEEGAALRLGKAFLREVRAVAMAPVVQTVRLARYARARWRLRTLGWEDRSARLSLGQRIYETGAGDKRSRSRIAALDDDICRMEGAKQSTRAAKGERDQLIL